MIVLNVIMLAFCILVMFHEGAVMYCWRWMSQLEKDVEVRYATVYSIIITIWLIIYMIGWWMK